MVVLDNFDLDAASQQDHLDLVHGLPPHALCDFARRYDWRLYPEVVLGWVMAQKGIDLGTALATFLNGGPERFNYFHKRDVPPQYLGTARLLDNICLRINSGYYLVAPDAGDAPSAERQKVQKWLAIQQMDRSEGTSGRWVLDDSIVAALLGNPAPGNAGLPVPASFLPRMRGRDALPDLMLPVEEVDEGAGDVSIAAPMGETGGGGLRARLRRVIARRKS